MIRSFFELTTPWAAAAGWGSMFALIWNTWHHSPPPPPCKAHEVIIEVGSCDRDAWCGVATNNFTGVARYPVNGALVCVDDWIKH